MAVSKCANAHDAYLECTNYAVTQLNLDNVSMYLDAGRDLLRLLIFFFWGGVATKCSSQDTPGGWDGLQI